MSTSSITPDLTQLLQTLTDIKSPLLALPKAVAAIQAAPAEDIAQLSEQATQLQGLNALFGDSGDSSNSSAADSTPYSFLSAIYGTGSNAASSNDQAARNDPSANLEPLLESLSSSGTATPSTAAALSTYERSLELEQAKSLFGTHSSSSSFFG